MSKTNWKERGIQFRHFRSPTGDGKPDSRGGATVAYTTASDGKTYAAVAYCNPSDNFSYQYGRAKSAGRLMQLITGTVSADSDKYFVDEEKREDYIEVISHFMVEDLRYLYNGTLAPKKAVLH